MDKENVSRETFSLSIEINKVPLYNPLQVITCIQQWSRESLVQG